MLKWILTKFKYSTFYFISYISNDLKHIGTMNTTVIPYINRDNYLDVLAEINKTAGMEVTVTCISKL